MMRLSPALMGPAVLLFTALAIPAAIANPPAGDPSVVEKTPALVAFWTFGEDAGQSRPSQGTREKHALLETGGRIPRAEGGSFSGWSAVLDGMHYLHVPHSELKDLDIHGKDARVSMFAVVRIDEMKKGGTVAGIWSEGKGRDDDTGTRQYSLLYNMGSYGGARQLTPHISAEGGVSRRPDGSAFPWCVDYAASRSQIPVGKWVTLGFTYDSEYLRAYFNGVMEPRPLDAVKDKRNDSYFTSGAPGGKPRDMNPYYHGKGIFHYDTTLHSQSKADGGADFTVGACYAVGHRVGNPLTGRICGLAVFNRTLDDAEMKKLHDAANIGQLPNLEIPTPADPGKN